MILELKYPGIFLAAVFIVAFFAVRIYFNRESIGRKTKYLLFALKYLFLIMFALFIFQPVAVRKEIHTRPVKNLIFFDNSRSVPLNDLTDSVLFTELSEYVSGNDNFEAYLFGKDTQKLESPEKFDFGDKFTSISTPGINYLSLKASPDGEFRSVTLVTDGNFSDAANSSLKPGVPVNIIYGSVRSDAPDIFIKEIYYDDTAPEKQPSVFSVLTGMAGRSTDSKFTITVTENGAVLKRSVQNIPQAGSFTTTRIELPEPASDFRELKFSIDQLPGEKNLYNNSSKAWQRKGGRSGKLLIIARSLSFDLTFLEKVYKNAGYSFTTLLENNLPDSIDIKKYRTLVTLDLPSANSGPKTTRLIEDFSSGLHFAGPGTSLQYFDRIFGTKLNNFRYIPASGTLKKSPSGTGEYLFVRNRKPFSISELPSVTYNSAFLPDEDKFRPAVNFSDTEGSKAVYQSIRNGSNILIANFSSFWIALLNDENEYFTSFILNLTDQASLDQSRERILVEPEKTGITAGEKIVIEGKILDENLRPASSLNAVLRIKELGLEVPFIKKGILYRAETVISVPGIYTAEVEAVFGETSISKEISLRITENDLETRVLGADLNVINSFTYARKGVAVPVSEAKEFIDKKTGVTEDIEIETRTDLTRNYYFFIILALLFLTELTIRKYKDLS